MRNPGSNPTIAAQIADGLPPTYLAGRLGRAPGYAPVVIEMAQSPGSASVPALESHGVRVTRIEQRPLVIERFVAAEVDTSALAALRNMRSVVAVRRAPPLGLPPLDRSRVLSGLTGLGLLDGSHEGLTGKGVVIGDVDTMVDVFHPAFFFADGGWYSWIDVDGDGVFTPGVDAVDLDGNGEAEPGETGMLLRARPVDITSLAEATGPRRSGFDPSLDWIYLDDNGNGRRDYGPTNGFDDSTPAFGEPLFVPDDVNGNGKLDPEERLVRLSTSKFRQIYVAVDGPSTFSHVYRRGDDLTTVQADYTGGAYGYADGLHATGVLGIAAGGVALPSRRWRGFAPDAEIVLGFGVTRAFTDPVMWVLEQHPDIMLHEAALWTGTPLDGSDAWSQIIDSSSTDMDIANACPVGNIGGARKHAVVDVPPEGAAFPVEVPDSTRMVEVTFQSTSGGPLLVQMQEPGGATHALPDDGPTGMLSGGAGYFAVDTQITDRGTAVISVDLWADDAFTQPIPSGEWRFVVDGVSSTRTVHGFVSDSESGFALGAAFPSSIAADANTVALPSVADDCISVGATPAHVESEGEVYSGGGPEALGEVRAYSARGPRIDGASVLDVTAPDNPWTPLPAGDIYPGFDPGAFVAEPASYFVFGGTSGAGAHLAGATALLAQVGIRGLAARQALRDGAVADGATGEVPNSDYGYGRLDVAGALGIDGHGRAPSITLRAEPAEARAGEEVRLVAEAADADDAASSLELRWDDGYDGSWDTPYGASTARLLTQGDVPLRAKVRVRDPEGHVAEAAVLVPIPPPNVQDGGVSEDGVAAADGGVEEPRVAGGGGGCGCDAPGSGSPLSSSCGVPLVMAIAFARRRSARRRRRRR